MVQNKSRVAFRPHSSAFYGVLTGCGGNLYNTPPQATGKNHIWRIFSSADNVSSAELMVLPIVRRPSVNFCFKSLLLLQFLIDNSEFFTGETRHIVPPCNKAGISNFCFELQKFPIAEIPTKTALLLQLLFDHSEFTEETRYIV